MSAVFVPAHTAQELFVHTDSSVNGISVALLQTCMLYCLIEFLQGCYYTNTTGKLQFLTAVLITRIEFCEPKLHEFLQRQ